VSTTGVSPVTVTVSATAPTRIAMLIGMTPEPDTSTPVALDRGEAGERDRHAVSARWQLSQAILSRAVGGRGSDLLESGPGSRLRR